MSLHSSGNSRIIIFIKNILLVLSISHLPAFSSTIYAQLNVTVKSIGNNTLEETLPEGVSASYYTNNNGEFSSYKYDPNEDVKIIIKFKEQPLSRQGFGKRKNSGDYNSLLAKMENEHSAFKNFLSQLTSDKSSRAKTIYKAPNNKIRFDYYTAINGVSLVTKKWVVEEIRKLPYVKSIYEDKEVQINDSQSNHVIGADSVWEKYSVTGKGIKICILDTGIDYLHPDLGGGIGAGFKVYGGYDFYNNDSNPMDDHGHGSHVAGIAAANGSSLKGVAPDALLYAAKVLNNSGSGPVSVIIAGIERAMDPDQNPLTDDAVDIINISLGAGGEPDDIISQAVDNASAAGIICVVAAGNTGSAYQTINSPGCARTAITVGATDNSDNFPLFSSRGPSNKLYAIKPDIVAPGVSINSAKPGGGYITNSGTSMATPHIAGCAALLLGIHPDWTPEMVKSALMISAKDIGLSVWDQGTGRVDINKAAAQTSLFIPSSLSFGMDEVEKSTWTKVDTLTIWNKSEVSETYNLSLGGTLIPGVTISFSSKSLNIEPNQSGKVLITLEVNNNVVPFFSNKPPGFIEKIIIQSSGQSYTVPFAFIKSPVFNITMDDGIEVIYLLGHNVTGIWGRGNPGNYISFLLPKGIYDLYAQYSDFRTVIVKENLIAETITNISIERSQAKNRIIIPMEDEFGNKIATGLREMTWEFINPRFSSLEYYLQPESDTLFLSDFSSNVDFNWACFHYDTPEKIYRINGGVRGLSSDIISPGNKDTYRHLQFVANVPPETKEIEMVEGIDSWGVLGGASGSIRLSYNNKLTYPFLQDAYYMPPGKNTSIAYFKKSLPELGHTSAAYKLNGFSSMEAYFLFAYSSPFYSDTSSLIPINLGPAHWDGRFSNYSNSITIRPHDRSRVFFNQSKDYFNNQTNTLQYELYSGSSIIKSGKMNDILTDMDYYRINVTPNEYRMRIFNLAGCQVNGTAANADANFYFDTRKSNSNPPYVKSLNIYSGGKLTDKLDVFKENHISLNLADDGKVASLLLQVRNSSDTSWTDLPVIQNQSLYSAVIPNSLKKGNTSIKITAIDNYNNKLEYTAEPAFLYGVNHVPVVDSITKTLAKEDSLFQSQLYASDIDENILTYKLDQKPAWLSIDSTTGLLWGTPGAKDIGTSFIKASVNDGNGGVVSSQFTLQVLHTNHSPVIAAIIDTVAFEDSLYKSKVVVQDIDNDVLKYRVIQGPAWLKVDSLSGLISGMPKADNIGYTSLQLKVNDGAGGEAEYSYNIHVYHSNHAPTISTLPDTTAKEDSLFIMQYSAYDIDGDSVTYFLEAPPGWLSIDSVYGILRGIPKENDLGKTIITAGAKDSFGKKSTIKFNLFVLHTNHAPSGFSLFSPADTDTLQIFNPPVPVSFTWKNAKDADKQDTLKYWFNLKGPGLDTLVAGIKDTTIQLNIMPLLEKNTMYTWNVDVSDGNIRSYSEKSFGFITSVNITGIDDLSGLPDTYFLSNNYPNPFNPVTKIRYYNLETGNVTIKIFDTMGKELLTLVNEIKPAGKYEITFDGSNLSSGVYFCRMQAGSFTDTKKIILLK